LFHTGASSQKPVLKILDQHRIIQLSVTSKHNILVLTDRGLFTLQQYELIPVFEFGAKSRAPKSMAIDHEGSIWLGTAASGLIQLISSKIRYVDMTDGLPKPPAT